MSHFLRWKDPKYYVNSEVVKVGHLIVAEFPKHVIILASNDHPNGLVTSTASSENASAPVWKKEPRVAFLKIYCHNSKLVKKR